MFVCLDGSTSNRFKASDNIYRFSVAAFVEIALHGRIGETFFKPRQSRNEERCFETLECESIFVATLSS